MQDSELNGVVRWEVLEPFQWGSERTCLCHGPSWTNIFKLFSLHFYQLYTRANAKTVGSSGKTLTEGFKSGSKRKTPV